MILALAAKAGFETVGRDLLPDDPDVVRARVRTLLGGGGVDVILLTGGTGVAPRDSTVEAVVPLFDRRLDGFGELFRMLSFAEVGPAAMLSRASAGVAGKVAVFVMPGSPAGVRLALERLILPELAHLVGELRRQTNTADKAPADPSPAPSHHHHHGGSHHS